MNIELLKCMGDQHRINAIRAEMDTLHTTPLEMLLVDWVEQLLDIGHAYEDHIDSIDAHDFSAEEINALGYALIGSVDETLLLLRALAEAGITTPDEIEELIKE